MRCFKFSNSVPINSDVPPTSADAKGNALIEDSYLANREIAVEIQADLVSLPASAGTFEVFDFVPPGLAQYADCAPEVMACPFVAELAQAAVESELADASDGCGRGAPADWRKEQDDAVCGKAHRRQAFPPPPPYVPFDVARHAEQETDFSEVGSSTPVQGQGVGDRPSRRGIDAASGGVPERRDVERYEEHLQAGSTFAYLMPPSCQRCPGREFARLLARMYANGMVAFAAAPGRSQSGLFAVWKQRGVSQRLIGDMRPANVWFVTPEIEYTGGDALTRMFVRSDELLELGKMDLSDYFYKCSAGEVLGPRFFGLRKLKRSALERAGVQLGDECFDAEGFTHPYLTVLPMGWGPSPAIAQSAHESLLYGAAGLGGARAQKLAPLLEPEGRWSSLRVPPVGSTATVHSLVIDDLLLFRTRSLAPTPEPAAEPSPSDALLAVIRERYTEAGLECREKKVQPFAPAAEALGYKLQDNTWSCTLARFEELTNAVDAVLRRGWTYAREIDSLIGRFTNVFLLHRFSLAIFSAAYVYIKRVGARRARLWPSVARELRLAADLLPLVQADVSRPCLPCLIQTDASPSGSGMVYSSDVPGGASALEEECRRPRPLLRNLPEEDPRVAAALRSRFDMPLESRCWRIGFRKQHPPGQSRHINELELEAVVDAIRWLSRSREGAHRRVVLELDSLVVACALRKGRSSRAALSKHLRRLAALTLALDLHLEARWTPTSRNMADGPSRGRKLPSPCVEPPRPARDSGLSKKSRACEAGDGPPPWSFWSPLLEASAGSDSRSRYRSAVLKFCLFVREEAPGEPVRDFADLDYWFAYWVWVCYRDGTPGRGTVEKALAAILLWLPEASGALPLSRRSLKGWLRLQPPKPYPPMPLHLALAAADLRAVVGDFGTAVALLVGFDCWLRISELANLSVSDIIDQRGHPDVAFRGVVVFLRETKTGARQAVRVADPDVANILVAWRDARAQVAGEDAALFPPAASLRANLAAALTALLGPDRSALGLDFVWHSLRHGGASRALMLGADVPDIMIRGRWRCLESTRRYLQAGRHLLMSIALPPSVLAVVQRFERAGGYPVLFSPSLRQLL